MATFSRTEEWWADAAADEVRVRVLDALRAQRAKIVDSRASSIEARTGSAWLARLDVSLMPLRWLPLGIVVQISSKDEDRATRIAVTIEDRLGMGTPGSGQRYEELFDTTIGRLRAATT